MAERVLLFADRRPSSITNQQHPFSHRLYRYRSAISNPLLSSATAVHKPTPMSRPENKPQAQQRRLVVFASKILQLSRILAKTEGAAYISNQILRSGTAAAANYGEARAAESRADFVHKLRIVLKELNETGVWLQLIAESTLLSPEMTVEIVAENEELCRIMAASIRTAGGFKRA
jgi:four helix bundle protein